MNNLHFTDDDKELLWRLGFNTSFSDDGPFRYKGDGFYIYVAKHDDGFIVHIHDDDNIIDALAVGAGVEELIKTVINQWHEKCAITSAVDQSIQAVLTDIEQFDQEKMMQHAEEEIREQEEVAMQEQQEMVMEEQQQPEDGVLS